MVSVIIPAGGSGERFSKTSSKLFGDCQGHPVIYRTVAAFFTHPKVDEIIVVHPPHNTALFASTLAVFNAKVRYAMGGDTRAQSVKNGVDHVTTSHSHLLIHDAARPNVSHNLINAVMAPPDAHPMVIPAVPVTDTIKQVKNNAIQRTVDRSVLMAVQTPQRIHKATLINAYDDTPSIESFTDEASLMESQGIPGIIVPGDPCNIKVTHPQDLTILNALMTMHH